MSAFQPFLQHFAAASDTASCQDYEEKEFVEFFSEDSQIIDIFTHCKLQPHKISQSLATQSFEFLLVLVSIRQHEE